MGFLSEKLSFDFGSSEIRIIRDGKISITEKATVAVDENGKIIAFGNSVNSKTHKNIINPVQEGAISDFNSFSQLIRYLIKKSLQKSSKFSFSPSLTTISLIQDSNSEVEIRAIRDSLEHAGARNVYMSYSSYAIAQGIGLDRKQTTLLIDAGAGKIAFSILDNEGIHSTSRLKFGAIKLIQVLLSKIQNKYGINFDFELVEKILHNHLSFQGSPKLEKLRVLGNDNNNPKSVEIDLIELNKSLMPYISIILNELQLTIDSYRSMHNYPINHIVLTGGLSRLNGIEKGLAEYFGLTVINKSGSAYAIKGLIMLDEDFEKNKNLIK